MEQKVIDGYAEKFRLMLEAYKYAIDVVNDDIMPRNLDNKEGCIFWREGALQGILIYFMRTLTEDERKINQMVFERMKEKDRSEDAVAYPDDYIMYASEILKEYGIDMLGDE